MITKHYWYRGYGITVTRNKVMVFGSDDYTDTVESEDEAKALIDYWVDGSSR